MTLEPIPREIDLPDEAATLRLGASIARSARPGDVVTLSGGLGVGKTTFARGLIAELAAQSGVGPEDVPSPTFSIVQTYEFGSLAVSHFDLYRLRAAEELAELGLEDALAEGLTLIEWPERAQEYLPAERLDITFSFSGQARRAVLIDRRSRNNSAY